MQKTLSRREHDLADPARQRARLAELDIPAFEDRAGGPLLAGRAETLQINVGRRCNQVCAHCHVDAGPDRTEVMSDDVLDACLELVEGGAFEILDVTGGAPVTFYVEAHHNSAVEDFVFEYSTDGVNWVTMFTLTKTADDDQAIYQWRGSDVRNIVSFDQRYPNVARFHLATNWRRSREMIIQARLSW